MGKTPAMALFYLMASEIVLEKIKKGQELIAENGISEEYCRAFLQIGQYLIRREGDIEGAMEQLRYARGLVEQMCIDQGGPIWEAIDISIEQRQTFTMVELWYEINKEMAFYDFESYLYYVEKPRPVEKRFFPQRRRVLMCVVKDLQALEEGKYKFYGLSMPPRVGKSTICIFFISWVLLRDPNSHNAMCGHSGTLARGFYSELLNLITSADYMFGDLYSYYHPGKTCLENKSAEEYTINLDKKDRFSSFTARGIDGTWTGAIDVTGYLYVDDLIRDREHSLSPIRMENTYQELLNKCYDRLQISAKTLMVGTLWNVNDPLERERIKHKDDERYLFRRMPALDENDESNFQYVFNPFTTEYYHEMRDRLEKPEWSAKYMQAPFVREGLLFPVEELHYFNGILPEGDGRIVSVVDVALGGGDSLSMPIGKEYANGDVYIFDWVFNNGPKEITMPKVTGAIIRNEIRQIRFEANQGGDLYCQWVDKSLQEQGYFCSCTHKRAPNNMEKMAKIEAYSGEIKRHFYFLQEKMPTKQELEEDKEYGITRYVRSKEYQKAMDELHTTVSIGKNPHDDAVDGITQLAMFVQKPFNNYQTRIIRSPI